MKKKILVVDDSSYMRMFLTKIIKKTDKYLVFDAPEKDYAIDVFNTVKPDIVTLDLDISENRWGGMEVLTEMIKINPETVVIIITASGDESIKEECMKLGAKNYIKKPVDTGVLLKTIEQYL
ncbi:response regulator [Clostridium cellulovorans]|uniref:Stage 0 sporulation protein A homolog n=1 Tax=Clostridium cellulovorans (strain ATCC 35296 / DSM 3052 / OCM 3 / 743B) TaxID=573061 RepID=D9SQT3_CLOC7|nr:response regulator [Clostridium cellulovorans]ADL52289.1 response regulator receiver protein [Clostridium cellulovorans 743B]